MKKAIVYCALAALVVAALVALSYLSPAKAPRGVSLASREWREYVPEGGVYSVSMPGVPVVAVKVKESALGGEVGIRCAILEVPAAQAHFVTYRHPLPPGEGRRHGCPAGVHGEQLRQADEDGGDRLAANRTRRGRGQGHALFSPTTGEINRQVVRFFVAKGHAYFNLVATTDEQEGEPFVSRFSDSFKLLPR
jgi:hypothetical protein